MNINMIDYKMRVLFGVLDYYEIFMDKDKCKMKIPSVIVDGTQKNAINLTDKKFEFILPTETVYEVDAELSVTYRGENKTD